MNTFPARLALFGALVLILLAASTLVKFTPGPADGGIKTPGQLIKEVGTIGGRSLETLANQLANISDAEEIEIGRRIEADFMGHFSPATSTRALEIFKRLLPFTKRKQLPYRLRVIESGMINAFAILGGSIFITTGLLNAAPSDDAIAMVLGHELAHVEYRHMVSQLGISMRGKKIVPEFLSRFGIGVLTRGFSVDQEYQADREGLLIAMQADFARNKAIQLFDLFKDHSRPEDRPDSVLEDFGVLLRDHWRTHPPAGERQKRLASVDIRGR